MLHIIKNPIVNVLTEADDEDQQFNQQFIPLNKQDSSLTQDEENVVPEDSNTDKIKKFLLFKKLSELFIRINQLKLEQKPNKTLDKIENDLQTLLDFYSLIEYKDVLKYSKKITTNLRSILPKKNKEVKTNETT